MKKNNGKKKKLALPAVKKEIKDFLLSEEGKIAKKNVAKMGITLAALSMMFPSQGSAGHTNYFFSTGEGTTGEGGHHSHNSHGSHSSHAHGAW